MSWSVLCYRGRSLNFTNNLYINLLFYFIIFYIHTQSHPHIHTPLPFLPTDHEISYQWSGNPYSWDSIIKHQQTPQRLLVKLLTTILNTKRLTVSTVGIQLLVLVNSLNGVGVHTYIHSNLLLFLLFLYLTTVNTN